MIIDNAARIKKLEAELKQERDLNDTLTEINAVCQKHDFADLEAFLVKAGITRAPTRRKKKDATSGENNEGTRSRGPNVKSLQPEITRRIAEGESDEVIARALNLQPSTIQKERKRQAKEAAAK